MIIISHRGNINGPDIENENNPRFIQLALENGYHCEIDVWLTPAGLFLGHDTPTYSINENFLKNERLWCHAKNIDALEFMLLNDIHCFWHQTDNCVLTSKGFIWTWEGKPLTPKSIACWIDANGPPPTNCYGICTDYPKLLN